MSARSIPSRRELFAWALAVVLIVTTLVSTNGPSADAGLAGPVTKTVYISTGENFPDALGAGPAAGTSLSPVLLVRTDSIPQETLDELNRLEPEEIIIVGGTAVVSSGVEDQLTKLDFSPTVTRVAGANRYATAASLSGTVFPTTGLYPRGAHAESEDIQDSTSDSVRLSTTITAPQDGMLLITAGADFARELPVSGGDVFPCWIGINSTDIGDAETGSFRISNVEDGSGDNAFEQNCNTQVGVNVTAGTYTVYYMASIGSGTIIGEGALTVLWVPFNGNGQVPTVAVP